MQTQNENEKPIMKIETNLKETEESLNEMKMDERKRKDRCSHHRCGEVGGGGLLKTQFVMRRNCSGGGGVHHPRGLKERLEERLKNVNLKLDKLETRKQSDKNEKGEEMSKEMIDDVKLVLKIRRLQMRKSFLVDQIALFEDQFGCEKRREKEDDVDGERNEKVPPGGFIRERRYKMICENLQLVEDLIKLCQTQSGSENQKKESHSFLEAKKKQLEKRKLSLEEGRPHPHGSDGPGLHGHGLHHKLHGHKLHGHASHVHGSYGPGLHGHGSRVHGSYGPGLHGHGHCGPQDPRGPHGPHCHDPRGQVVSNGHGSRGHGPRGHVSCGQSSRGPHCHGPHGHGSRGHGPRGHGSRGHVVSDGHGSRGHGSRGHGCRGDGRGVLRGGHRPHVHVHVAHILPCGDGLDGPSIPGGSEE